jgi:hypothetical protein
VAPSAVSFLSGALALSVRPAPRLRLDTAYLVSRLRELDDPERTARSIFTNHIARLTVNYQFTRALSLRAIGEYSGVLLNQSLVALTRDKRLVADLLLTYLAHPGTAVYVGYTAGFDNDGSLRADDAPGHRSILGLASCS